MSTENFDQELIAKISREKIAPKPRWHFLLKDYVVWVSGGLALLVGAASVSVMIYLFKYSNFALHAASHKSFGESFLLTLPYFWLIFLGLFVFIVYYNFKHTKKGYFYSLPLVIFASIIVSLLLGLLFYSFGLGKTIDDVLGKQVPFYGKVFNRQLDFWFAPEEGRLTGVVVNTDDDAVFYLLDPAGEGWQVFTETDSRFPGVRVGLPISAVGRAADGNKFYAEMVRPAGPPGQGFFAHPRMRGGDRFDCRLDDCQPPVFFPPGGPRIFISE
jgi:hypothetical protein